MPSGSVVSRITRASLEQLQSQFEALAPKFPNLQHRYIVHLGGSDLPFPARIRESDCGHRGYGFLHGRLYDFHARTVGEPTHTWTWSSTGLGELV